MQLEQHMYNIGRQGHLLLYNNYHLCVSVSVGVYVFFVSIS